MKAKQTKQRNDHSSCALYQRYICNRVDRKEWQRDTAGTFGHETRLISIPKKLALKNWPFRLFIIIILHFLLRTLQVLFSYILHRFHLLYKASCTQLARSSDALGDSLTSIGRRGLSTDFFVERADSNCSTNRSSKPSKCIRPGSN